MGTTDSVAPERSAFSDRRPGGSTPPGEAERPAVRPFWRFLPGITAYLFLVVLLLLADTSVGDVARYTGYALWGVLLPGTLVFRALRWRPYSLLEDLAYGAVTGLVLELVAWFLLVSLGAQSVAVAWPLAVVIPFAAVPRLRRHWHPRGYQASSSLGWSWSVAGTVMLSSAYFHQVFLSRYPVLPTGETSRIFGDMPYMLSLAANAKQHVPLTVPQAAGEPLYYHWFSFAHMAMTDMVGHIDLPVVESRLMVPALAALSMVITAVVARRLTGRAWAGPLAAVLVFAVGEFTATYPNNVNTWTFGAPAVRLMFWSSLSLTYSQPLLIALMGVVGDALRRSGIKAKAGKSGGEDGKAAEAGRSGGGAPLFGPGVFVLTALFALASSAAKASTLPVTLAGLAVAGFMMLIGTRRVPWTVVGLGAILTGAQVFATAVIFNFESYGLEIAPFGNIQSYWADPGHARPAAFQALVVAATLAAFLLNHHVKLLGMIPLLRHRRFPLEPVQWFLLGAAVAGPAAYLTVNGYNSSYFTIAALPFGVVLSAWGYCESFERAALPRRAKAALAVAALAFIALLTFAIYRYSDAWAKFVQRLCGDSEATASYSLLLAALGAAAALALIALVCGALWWLVGRARPALRGRGGIVLLTAALAAGSPGLAHDALQSREEAWVGSWVLPGSQVEAARWIRAHSEPSDVLVTNSHCWEFDDYANGPACNNVRSQWLSGYSERSVLIEGWAYAPRAVALTRGGTAYDGPFWDQELFALNEDAVYRPTEAKLRTLHDLYHVRYVVVHRPTGHESPRLRELAPQVFDNGRIAVYRLP
ncbi:hypothetical protein [Streptomyces sp. NBC_01443]|uniref:hypothetical protein n=1 Tax=Streptomyces sp. NBC_01443 TaxID=2903868 RepID=UPI00224FFE5F|nr:hypothetical protein [Streptomyces sp. NBC_01443]MCX4626652.1 hypothetical protein [Streptomyces sp. NBC_01443]